MAWRSNPRKAAPVRLMRRTTPLRSSVAKPIPHLELELMNGELVHDALEVTAD